MKTKYSYKEAKEALLEKSKLINQVWSEAGQDYDFSKVKSLEGNDTNAKIEKLESIQKELSDIHDDLKAWEELLETRKKADVEADYKGGLPKENPGEYKKEIKSFAEQYRQNFIESKAFKHKDSPVDLDIDTKTIVQTGAGWAPESIRLPRVELYPLRQLRIADVFPTYSTGQSSIKYMEETTHTNNASEIAEETNAASVTVYGEAALAMTERTVPIEKVAVWIPVTEEQLEDVEGAEDFVNNRLSYMIRNQIDGQLIAGDGSTPNLRGVFNATNVQSQAKGEDPTPDAVYKAMTKVRGTSPGTGFAEPSAALFNPSDWQDIRLLRTTDGVYIFGNPTESGPERIWGVPVIISSAVTENTAVVGDFANYAGLYIKRGLTVEKTNSHGSFFAAGVLAIKATMRCAAVYFRGTAFCKITSI